MKVNTRELEGAALDWAVAMADEAPVQRHADKVPWQWAISGAFDSLEVYSPSTDWAAGGPVIEREGLNVRPCYNGGERTTSPYDSWKADLDFQNGTMTLGKLTQYGPTALVAAMRCFVASKLGETVDIPDELV